MPEDNGTGRLDRIERILDAIAVKLAATNNDFDRMREEHDRDYKQLMTAQVLMQDNLRIMVEKSGALRSANRQARLSYWRIRPQPSVIAF
jgi:hypothetical protein